MAHNTNQGSLDVGDDLYNKQSQLWREVRASMAGKYAVIDIVTCLPSPQYKNYATYSGMTQEQSAAAMKCNQVNSQRVAAYWARGRFFNATGRTAASLSGMIWSKSPDSKLSTAIDYLNDNADGSGSNLRVVVQKCTDDVTAVGRYGMLVDMPSNDRVLTMAEMEMPENSPRIISYKAEQIVFVRVDGLSNSIDEVRLVETRDVRKNDFDWETETLVRRLVMRDGVYYNELYTTARELISSTTPLADGKTLNFIPFQFFGSDSNGPEYSKVPLYDLANSNLGHFVLDCDNRDNLHYHGQGMTNVFSDSSEEEILESNPNGLDVGPKGRNFFGKDDRVEVLQIAATGAIPSEMMRDEQRMIMQGAQLVSDTPATQTLGAKEMEFGASTSTLKRISINITDGMKNVLGWVSLFLSDTEESTYTLNTDFITDDMSPEMIAKHIEMVQGGILPKVTLYETARSVGFTKLDDDEIKDLAEQDDLMLGGVDMERAQVQVNDEEQEDEE